MAEYKGDDTAAFGNNFITITLDNPLGYPISKAEFVVNAGCIRKTFLNPVFPLIVNFNTEDTQKLGFKNTGHLIVWDNEGRPKQCDGFITFEFKNGVIND